MSEKNVELIRQFLRKIILPIRQKKEKFLSRLHFSLNTRIAVNYAKLFVIYGIIIVLMFSLVFLFFIHHDYKSKTDSIVYMLESEQDISFEDYSNPYYHDGIEMRVTDENDGIMYDDSTSIDEHRANFADAFHISGKNGDRSLFILSQRTVETGNGSYHVEFSKDISNGLEMYIATIRILLIAVLILAIVMSVSGSKQLRFIMTPIKKMSDAANSITVNNLSSERLNVEGTKNELKDLAATINEMLDRLEVSYESQKQFVSDASHELRTPIAVIQGYVNMVDRWGKEDPSIMEESIQAIKEEAQSMKELVEKLLFLSRHDKKTLKLDKKIFNMREVVEELLKETKMVAVNRNVKTEGLEDVNVYGDKQSLKQAVRIFVDNAVKYSSDGDDVIISCKNCNGSCKIIVEDTGIGMKAKDMDNIFERFYRSDDVRNKSISGHGLGLSIAKLIILKHTGRIKIRSQYKKGTRFTIILPRIYR